MPTVKITVMGYLCTRCHHKWIPSNTERKPNVCPKCKSPYWDKKKVRFL